MLFDGSNDAAKLVSASRKSLFWAWLPVVLWLGIIAVESSGMMSSDNTDSVLYSVLTTIFGTTNRQAFEVFHALLRKFGHFTGYAILSLLFFRALIRTISLEAVAAAYRILAILAVIFTFVVASLDELHQSYLPSRTGVFSDVLLDTSGAVAVQIVLLLVIRRRQARGLAPEAGHGSDRFSVGGTCTSSRTAATTASPAEK